MSAARKLRAVKDGETASQAPGSVLDATEHGDSRDVMAAMRKRLAASIDDPATPARDLAALSRRLLEVDKTIREIDLAREERERQTATEATEDEDGLGDI
mgnify:FL=1|jgi:hypothetical protein|nr:MAG TPA: hypothetical protein [Caudoviricetes sp.]